MVGGHFSWLCTDRKRLFYDAANGLTVTVISLFPTFDLAKDWRYISHISLG